MRISKLCVSKGYKYLLLYLTSSNLSLRGPYDYPPCVNTVPRELSVQSSLFCFLLCQIEWNLEQKGLAATYQRFFGLSVLLKGKRNLCGVRYLKRSTTRNNLLYRQIPLIRWIFRPSVIYFVIILWAYLLFFCYKGIIESFNVSLFVSEELYIIRVHKSIISLNLYSNTCENVSFWIDIWLKMNHWLFLVRMMVFVTSDICSELKILIEWNI